MADTESSSAQASDTKTYPVLSPVRVDGDKQTAGAVQLTEDEARPLRTSGVLGEKVTMTDSARTLANEHDVDLSGVRGSGKGGKITKSDVEEAIDAQ